MALMVAQTAEIAQRLDRIDRATRRALTGDECIALGGMARVIGQIVNRELDGEERLLAVCDLVFDLQEFQDRLGQDRQAVIDRERGEG